mmetsp:Transcript_18728/g.34513  ORF Transcript_18728/g.34513 Transcript_18728/m.34513 type:complete len:91 (+) Transcript_18728:464-736(+)
MPFARDTSGAVDTNMATSCNRFPPALIIRGQHDFVTEACTRGWKDILASPEKDGQSEPKDIVIQDCAHYPHFEQPENYSYEVEQFCYAAE